MLFGPLKFLPVDIHSYKDLCLKFAADAFFESFGSYDRFHEEDGKGSERYIDWLKERLAADSSSAAHVWLESRIIGQVTLGAWKLDPSIGYVNLYYLIPECRGKGYSVHLEKFALAHLKKRGFKTARLSVSPTNLRAVRFYQKNGWKDLGPRPQAPHVHLMEKSL